MPKSKRCSWPLVLNFVKNQVFESGWPSSRVGRILQPSFWEPTLSSNLEAPSYTVHPNLLKLLNSVMKTATWLAHSPSRTCHIAIFSEYESFSVFVWRTVTPAYENKNDLSHRGLTVMSEVLRWQEEWKVDCVRIYTDLSHAWQIGGSLGRFRQILPALSTLGVRLLLGSGELLRHGFGRPTHCLHLLRVTTFPIQVDESCHCLPQVPPSKLLLLLRFDLAMVFRFSFSEIYWFPKAGMKMDHPKHLNLCRFMLWKFDLIWSQVDVIHNLCYLFSCFLASICASLSL